LQLGRSPSHIKTFGFYKEIRIENTLTDENGREVKLKPGVEVEVTIEADPEATTLKV